MHFAFFGRKGIKTARLIQKDYQTVIIELVPTPEFVEEERSQLLEVLTNKVENKLTFVLNIVEEISQKNSGKFKFVVSEIPGQQ